MHLERKRFVGFAPSSRNILPAVVGDNNPDSVFRTFAGCDSHVDLLRASISRELVTIVAFDHLTITMHVCGDIKLGDVLGRHTAAIRGQFSPI